MTSTPWPRARITAPWPLVVAAATAALQGAVFLVYAVLEITRTDSARVLMGATTSLFFLLYGLGLVVCAWQLLRLASWARSPVVLAQLIQLGLAWSFWGQETRTVSLGLAVVSLIVLVGLFHPATVRVLADDPEAERDS